MKRICLQEESYSFTKNPLIRKINNHLKIIIIHPESQSPSNNDNQEFNNNNISKSSASAFSLQNNKIRITQKIGTNERTAIFNVYSTDPTFSKRMYSPSQSIL